MEIFSGNYSLIRIGGGFSADWGLVDGYFLFDRHFERDIERLPRACDVHFFFRRRKAGGNSLQRILTGCESGKSVNAFSIRDGLLLRSTCIGQRDGGADDRSA